MLTSKHNDLSEIEKNKNNLDSEEIEIKSSYFNKKKSVEGIGIALSSVFRLEKLFMLIVGIATNMLGAKKASLMILDGNIMRFKAFKSSFRRYNEEMQGKSRSRNIWMGSLEKTASPNQRYRK